LTENYGSDPYCKDLFLEIDFMEYKPNGEQLKPSEIGREMMKNPFHKRDIIYHIDMEIYGGEIVPYKEQVEFDEIRQIWRDYFMHNDDNNWRRGVFHYCIFVYHTEPNGFAFSGDISPYWGYNPGTNAFVISFTTMQNKDEIFEGTIDFIFATGTMHEMGHNMGIRWGNPHGCDKRSTIYPWQIGWWIYRNYKSTMNYRYTYRILDYSDGSHGIRDSNDWANIDLSYFEKPEGKSLKTNMLHRLENLFSKFGL